MTNRPLVVPAGVTLSPLLGDEAERPIERPILVCEGRCRPSWTPHVRITLGEALLGSVAPSSPTADVSELSVRYRCEHCRTSRRWGY